MSKKEKKAKKIVRLDDITNFFGETTPPGENPTTIKPLKVEKESKPDVIPWKQNESSSSKKKLRDSHVESTDDAPKKKESLTTIKKKVDEIYQKNIDNMPPESRLVSVKDIKTWIINNPGKSISSQEFFNWYRSENGDGEINPYVKRFGDLLLNLGIDYIMDVDVKGYVYDFFIPDMSLYIDIDPSSLETDDPKNKIAVTIEKNRIDVVDIWRKINVTRESRCKPYRFLAIKERLYQQEIRSFLNEYVDWYYQKVSDETVSK